MIQGTTYSSITLAKKSWNSKILPRANHLQMTFSVQVRLLHTLALGCNIHPQSAESQGNALGCQTLQKRKKQEKKTKKTPQNTKQNYNQNDIFQVGLWKSPQPGIRVFWPISWPAPWLVRPNVHNMSMGEGDKRLPDTSRATTILKTRDPTCQILVS